MNSEEAFLFSTFKEFHKCWKSGTNARVFIESVNGRAFVTFSAFIGFPEEVHFKPRQWKRNPSKEPRKKSANKTKRDNDRAARFQAKKGKKNRRLCYKVCGYSRGYRIVFTRFGVTCDNFRLWVQLFQPSPRESPSRYKSINFHDFKRQYWTQEAR